MINQITIGKVKKDKPNAENIYIGRGSPLGNPYPITANASRDEVCDRYDVYIRNVLQDTSSPQYKEMVRLLKMYQSGQSLHLQCFCAPLRCHGESIKSILETTLKKMNQCTK